MSRQKLHRAPPLGEAVCLAAAWPKWRENAKGSLLAHFARNLCRDEAALLAAMQKPWSNGPVEGNIHRLKLIKRSMYGRAKFDLLRLRVVHAACFSSRTYIVDPEKSRNIL